MKQNEKFLRTLGILLMAVLGGVILGIFYIIFQEKMLGEDSIYPLLFGLITVPIVLFVYCKRSGVVLLLIFLSILQISHSSTIGIGVVPVSLNTTKNYYDFCFFNEGDTDAIYTIKSGSIEVSEMSFLVPSNTSINNCVKKRIYFYGDKGSFFVEGRPNLENYSSNIVYRVKVDVNVSNFFRKIVVIAFFLFVLVFSLYIFYKKKNLLTI